MTLPALNSVKRCPACGVPFDTPLEPGTRPLPPLRFRHYEFSGGLHVADPAITCTCWRCGHVWSEAVVTPPEEL